MLREFLAILAALCWFSPPMACAQSSTPPRPVDARLKIRLFAEHPQIVTPTGIDVDAQGRVWVIESNTHFPPAEYKGHPTDRVFVMQDANGDGSADTITTFADGFTHAMSVAVRREAGGAYLATRREVFLLPDENHDGVADQQTRVLQLDSPGDYPHNGLAGFAFDAVGNMYIGLGENLGAPYKIIGSDQKSLSGEGEGGSIYRCRLDGTGLVRVATGFWNPHASCIDAFGRLFSVDNDPDSRPPCRLLHVVDGGDYGYRFRNGRRGIHPFTAWDGELPGTLPMVAGTGEAPSGIVAYESDGLPEDYAGNLLVTSWGDHRIDRFRLKPKQSSFTSMAEPIVTGGENFRPVGLAVAPDGSLYCSDWVLKDYHVHGKGRIWRISAVNESTSSAESHEHLSKRHADELLERLNSRRIEVRRAAAQWLAKTEEGAEQLRFLLGDKTRSARARIEAFWALTSTSHYRFPSDLSRLPRLAHSDDEVASALLRHFLYDRIRIADQLPDMESMVAKNNWWCLYAPDSAHPIVPDDGIDRSSKRVPIDRAPAADQFVQLLRAPSTRDLLFPSTMLQPFFLQHLTTRPQLLGELFEIEDPFIYLEMVSLTARVFTPAELLDLMPAAATPSARVRVGLVLAARIHERNGLVRPVLEAALADPDASVRRVAVQWVGEEGIAGLRAQLETALSIGEPTADLMQAVIASMELLDGAKRAGKDEGSGAEYILKILRDGSRPPTLRAVALRMLAADDPGFDAALAGQLLAANDDSLRTETVRAVAVSMLANRLELLSAIALDETAPVRLRADALAGLANVSSKPNDTDLALKVIQSLMRSNEPLLKIESIRVLRSLSAANNAARSAVEQAANEFVAKVPRSDDDNRTRIAEELTTTLRKLESKTPGEIEAAAGRRPASIDEWLAALTVRGDAEAGRRAFFRTGGAGCARCHRIEGRGGNIGPDLSTIARNQNNRKIAESILTPSKDIAPQFLTWQFVMNSGKMHVGFIIGDERNGRYTLGTSEGTTEQIEVAAIEERKPQNVSVMPEKLVDQISVAEFQDIVAYLLTLR